MLEPVKYAKHSYKLLSIVVASTVFVAGCDNKMSGLSDEDLADSMHDCGVNQNQSPGMAIKCDNIERECKRRRDEGRFVC